MRSLFISALCVVSLSGCAPGFIYTDVTDPLTTNMSRTKVVARSGKVNSEEIRIPAGRINVTGAWNSRAIGDAAANGGLHQIYYADLRTISILGGLWRRRSAIVYGE